MQNKLVVKVPFKTQNKMIIGRPNKVANSLPEVIYYIIVAAYGMVVPHCFVLLVYKIEIDRLLEEKERCGQAARGVWLFNHVGFMVQQTKEDALS